MLENGGVGLLAGSDCGASNSFAFPSWVLHRELALMDKLLDSVARQAR